VRVNEELISDNTYTLGPEDAPVTLVEFSDFECPACKAEQPVVSMLEQTYQGQLRVAYRNFPLPQHASARPAAEAAQAAGLQGKFWEYADLLFQNQPNFDRNSLLSYAQKLGLDSTKFAQDMDSTAVAKQVGDDYNLATKLNLMQTPSFFVNNTLVTTDLEGAVKNAITDANQNSNGQQNTTTLPTAQPQQSSESSPSQSNQTQESQSGVIEIDYTADGFTPKNITVPFGQIVRWVNKTQQDIVLAQRIPLYDALQQPKTLKPGEMFEMPMTKEKLWTYAESNSNSFGSIFVLGNGQQ
jgi:predicted DsbA family dithiol-disulfide isomerase